MGVLPDWMIEQAIRIEPFAPQQHRPGVISYGVTSYGYDAAGGLTNVAYSTNLNASVSYRLNRLGQAVEVADGTGVRTNEWHASGRLEQEILAGGVAIAHAYDALGRRTNVAVSAIRRKNIATPAKRPARMAARQSTICRKPGRTVMWKLDPGGGRAVN